jgi:hypothetical protein
MASLNRRSSSKRRPDDIDRAAVAAWLDARLAQVNVADALCKALASALEGKDRKAISNAMSAVAVRMALVEEDSEEWSFWNSLLEQMASNDHVHPAANTAARRTMLGRYNRIDGRAFLAKCIVDRVSVEGGSSRKANDSGPTPVAEG